MGQIFIPIFLLLLFLANLFLFRDGLWLYQDQSFWYKNYFEAFAFYNTQFHLFNVTGYYLGFDQGVLSSNNLGLYSIFFGLFQLFGSSDSQIAVSLLGYILAFVSFYLFSTLFFKDKKICYVLALVFTFNPLMYSLRGHGLIYAAAPLFVYSFYKFYSTQGFSGKYLLLNLVSLFIWISNVRFLQLNFFVVLPYVLFCMFVITQKRVQRSKLLLYGFSLILVFIPVIYSFIAPLLQRTPSIFNYGNVYNNFVVKGSFYDMFNPFQSANVFLYQHPVFIALGMLFVFVVLLLLIKSFQKKPSLFLKINIALLVLGLTFFELGYIVGRNLYPFVIKLVPFLTNSPFNALYVSNIPFILLLGIIGLRNIKVLYLLATYFIIISLVPLLNLSFFPFQKYKIEKIPQQYREYFVNEYKGIAESTMYIPYHCWRAEYMFTANTPTQCINFGLHYAPVVLDNPRAVSSEELYLAQKAPLTTNIDNMRVTHNLKNIIVAKDIVESFDAGPLHDKKTVQTTNKIDKQYAAKNGLIAKYNDYFNHYMFGQKDMYEFFLYVPQQTVVKDSVDTIFDNSLILSDRPVVLSSSNKDKQIMNSPDIKVSYKQSQFDATKYYLKLSNVTPTDTFILQFNQAFKPGWELKWIDKQTYDAIQCSGEFVSYSITNNERCIYDSTLVDVRTVDLLRYPSVSNEQHIRGNYVANAWYIPPNEIPAEKRSEDELYAVIVYTNQLYYTITLIISGVVLLLLCLYTLMQELLKHKK